MGGAIALGVLVSAISAVGQIVGATGNTGPSVALSPGMDIPRFNVSTMKVERGDWAFKPVYEIVDMNVRVVGLFASAKPGTTTGLNFTAVYYQRPLGDDCGEWLARVWPSASASQSATAVKAMYGISDFQDVYWEVEGLPVPTVGETVGEEKMLKGGFASDDPMGELVGSFDQATRNETVEVLQQVGYPIADIPIEKGGGDEAKWWLAQTARMFDRTIGRNLTSLEWESEISAAYASSTYCVRPSGPFTLPKPDWFGRCTPDTQYGDWEPDGTPCNCSTTGPWPSVCGRFTADARGKVVIRVPYPPPVGSEVEVSGGVNAAIDVCVCTWMRECYAPATKRKVRHISADCVVTASTESGPGMYFQVYGHAIATSAQYCASTGKPANIPDNSQSCGLERPTPNNTSPNQPLPITPTTPQNPTPQGPQ